ncbi:MAG: RIP metalloprotease RseP [Gemmatimonadales bacterium]|nr:RIP metalloprotease RseP [Gemmatimonadales bacterium]
MSNVLVNILSLIVVLGVLIFVHELGHFLAAKAAGMYVHRFSVGMGAPVKALTWKRGETEYCISWLPLGGYVKVASGEEDPSSAALEGGAANADVPKHRMYESKSIPARIIFVLAGVAMNVLFAWLVFSGLNYANGSTVYPVTAVGGVNTDSLPPGAEGLAVLVLGDRIERVAGQPMTSWEDIQEAILSTPADSFAIEIAGKPPIAVRIHRDALEARVRAAQALIPYIAPVIGTVVAGGPGDKAGIKTGDTLVAINGEPIGEWRRAVEAIEAHPDMDLTLTVGRAGGRQDLAARTLAESDGSRTVGKLRLGPDVPERHEPVSFGGSLVLGAKQTVAVSTQIVRVVRGMFSGRVSTREVGGPIAIGMAAGQSAQLGVTAFLAFMATISVNLAVLNLLPIPVLDGGQLLFLLGEAVLRRPLSIKLRERLTFVGLILIGLLMVLAFSNDIRRLLGLL